MEFELLGFEIAEGVATITLNRPQAANAFDVALARELLYAIMHCDEDESVRAVVLTGTGKTFSAGGDLVGFRKAGDRAPALIKEITTYLHAAIARMARMDPPVIVAVNGAAAGAGFSLACAGDLVYAAESARFTLAYTRVGLVPDGSSTYYLPRIIGVRRTLELMLTNRTLSAAEALEWGLVNRVVPDAELLVEARKTAICLAAGPTSAYGRTKRLVVESLEGLETQMEKETRAIAEAAHTSDAREGIAAFLEKRQPAFRGR